MLFLDDRWLPLRLISLAKIVMRVDVKTFYEFLPLSAGVRRRKAYLFIPSYLLRLFNTGIQIVH